MVMLRELARKWGACIGRLTVWVAAGRRAPARREGGMVWLYWLCDCQRMLLGRVGCAGCCCGCGCVCARVHGLPLP